MSTLTLPELYQALQDHDITGEYENLTYANTINSLYPSIYSNANLPWFSFFPFANWDNFYAATYPDLSPVQKAMVETLTLAAPLAPKSGSVFIDIANYANVDELFLNQQVTGHRTVMAHIAQYINSLSNDVTPILRVLIGNQGQIDESSLIDGSLPTVQAFFQGLVTHPKARMYFGFYAPNLTIAEDGRGTPTYEALGPFVDSFWQELRKILHALFVKLPPKAQAFIENVINFLEQEKPKLHGYIKLLLHALAKQATGWNHAKFISVNGTTSVASGYNWWNGYATGKLAGNSLIFDTGVKFGGDMAVSSHRFMDDVFSYLNNPHPHDKWSFAGGSPFVNGPNFVRAATSPVPLWSATHQSSTQLPGAHQVKGISIASVTRDPTNSAFNFPTLAFNAVRDFSLDLLSVLGDNLPGTNPDVGALLAPELSDDNEVIKFLLDAANVSPAAWSSRYGRVWAIANAKQSVKIFNQAIVNRFFEGQPIIGVINEELALLAEKTKGTYTPWTGRIWGYDTMIAIAQALARDIPVHIIASSAPNTPFNDGYQDAVTCSGFTLRLEKIMHTLKSRGVISLPPGVTVEQRVASRFEYRHMYPYNERHYSAHSKCLIVDDYLFYGGSDNAYPNYNDQFGTWIGDASVAKLSEPDGYWTHLHNIAKTDD